MKKALAITAVLALLTSVASAELLKNFKYDGKLEINAYGVNNADYDENSNDKLNDVDTRLQIDMGFDLNDDASAVVSIVKNNRQYGTASEHANTVLNNMFFHQAYLNLKDVFGMNHKVGRQYYGNPGDLIIYYGPTYWPYTVGLALTGTNALDGWSATYENGKLNLDLVYGKDTNAGAAPDTDQDVSGINAKYKLMKEAKIGGFFYRYSQQAGAAAGPDDHLDILGIKAYGDIAGFKYNALFAMNTGKNNTNVNNTGYTAAGTNDYKGTAFMVNANYGLDIAGKITFAGEYAMGSGDDKTTDDKVDAFYSLQSDYRPGLIWGGYNGTAGLTNLTTWNLGATWNPSAIEKLGICAKYYYFAPTEDKSNGASIGYDKIGTEFDFALTWNHSDNVTLKGYYAVFSPDSDYATTMAKADNDAETMFGTSLNVKF